MKVGRGGLKVSRLLSLSTSISGLPKSMQQFYECNFNELKYMYMGISNTLVKLEG